MEPVQQTTKLSDITVVGDLRVDVIENTTESKDQVRDLGVCPAHRPQWIVAAKHLGQRRVQGVVLGLLVRKDLVDEKPVDAANSGNGVCRSLHPKRVCRLAQLLHVGPYSQVLCAESVYELGVVLFESDLPLLGHEHSECIEDDGDVDGLL